MLWSSEELTSPSDILSTEEIALLLYLETCAVDHHGRVDTSKMNAADFDLVASWVDRNILEFGRIVMADHVSTIGMRRGTHWVHFSTGAYLVVAHLRRDRADRGWENHVYETTRGGSTQP